jgi:hypothetical protein
MNKGNFGHNSKIFIAPGTIKSKKSVSDFQILNEAINAFFECNFKAMKGFIFEYGEAEFFTDLKKYFDLGYWRNPCNKYCTYTSIVISFFTIYE